MYSFFGTPPLGIICKSEVELNTGLKGWVNCLLIINITWFISAAQEIFAAWMTIPRHCGQQNKSKLDKALS